MVPLTFAIIGIAFGWWRATKRGGNLADKLQYAVGHGFAFFLVSYFIGLALIMTGIL